MNLPIVTVALIALLPLGPAFLLFRFLPSTAAVKGPFKGLQINLTGAFGGYFILVLALSGLYMQLASQGMRQERERREAERAEQEKKSAGELWDVVSYLEFESPEDFDTTGIEVTIKPPETDMDICGERVCAISIEDVPVRRHGTARPTRLLVDKPGYKRLDVWLDTITVPPWDTTPYTMHWDPEDRSVTVSNLVMEEE